jgi:hypothetical protein
MKLFRADQVDSLDVAIGETFKLESLRQAVVPPYVTLMPFIELPNGIKEVARESLEEDGIHGVIFVLKAEVPVKGELIVGFKDLRRPTEGPTHKKTLQLEAK